VFASMTVTTGSLLPAIAVHAMVDLRILGLPDLARDVLPPPAPTAVRPQPAE
jgi:membrane protease YdiL (CAAX protease family)